MKHIAYELDKLNQRQAVDLLKAAGLWNQCQLRGDGRIEWVCEHGVGHTIWAPKEQGDAGYVHGCDGCCADLKINKGYSIKWNVEFSTEYMEYLLNLATQGYFSELWEEITKHVIVAKDVFIKELHDMHYKGLIALINSEELYGLEKR